MDSSARRIPWHLVALLAAALGVAGFFVYTENQESTGQPALAAGRAGPSDRRIVPGHRAGFITLGLPVDEVEQRLGPGQIRPAREGMVYVFPDQGLSCAASQGRVISVLVRNPELKTARGIGVGSDVDQVVRNHGGEGVYEYDERSPGHYTLHYWAQGIHFTVEHTRVVGILIQEPVFRGE